MTLSEHVQTIWPNCKVEFLPTGHVKVTREDGTVDISAGKLKKYLKWSMVNVHKLKITEEL